MEDLATAFGAVDIVIIGVVVVVVGVLGFLMPLYIVAINGKLRRMNEQLDVLAKVSGGNSVTKNTLELLSEARIQNDLQRQLIRAYGHEPEA